MKTPAMVSDLYDYYDTRYAWTDCEDWRPDGSGQNHINCNTWLCNETKYHTWRWQNMPGKNNTVPERVTGGFY